jgi:hypothetical protein
MKKVQCPCCGNFTLHKRGDFEICQVCFWEDDNASEVFNQPAPDRPQGPNYLQLPIARESYMRFGYAEERNKNHVRHPLQEELPENSSNSQDMR